MDPAGEPTADMAAVAARVLASRTFAKTARLSSFLRCICTARVEGRLADLTEQRIGQQVFGRSGHYNPSEDTIVRSTARLLRQRLELYYSEEGRDDPWRLTVPRGAYAPVVVARTSPCDAAEAPLPEPDDAARDAAAVPAAGKAPPHRWRRGLGAVWPVRLRSVLRAPRRVYGSVLLALGLAVAIAGGMGASALGLPTARPSVTEALWTELFPSDRDTLLVVADSNLVAYQLEVLREIPLDDYIARRIAPDPNRADVKFLRNRQTAISSVGFALELGRLANARQGRLQARYARDLRLNELKAANAILLGVRQSNPWVDLFRDRFNFHIDWDVPTEKFLVRNDRPLPGERASYEYSKDDPKRRGYVHIAFTRGLGGAGHVLFVAGTTAPGTEAAQEFVLDPARMQPVLQRALRGDGRLGDFEVLLECVMRAGGSTDVQVVAVRTGEGGVSR